MIRAGRTRQDTAVQAVELLRSVNARVLGVVLRTRSGRVVRAGGRTVKNVQGYDLTRPFVGSFGALGEAISSAACIRIRTLCSAVPPRGAGSPLVVTMPICGPPDASAVHG